MSLKIDYRENKCIDILKELSNKHSKEINIMTENMDIGDIHIADFMILERKTLNDAVASIKDGRYIEQKSRMLAYKRSSPNQIRLGYIIEGHYSYDPNLVISNVNNKSISGMIINSILRDNIDIWFTKDIKDTCHLIINLYTRITENPQKYIKDEGMNTNDQEYSAVQSIKVKKKDNYDPQYCLISQLNCIPGLSVKKSKDIIQHLKIKSLFELGDTLKKADNANSILANVPGIGKKLSATIINYVIPNM